MLPALANANHSPDQPNETPDQVLAAFHAHQQRTGRGNATFTRVNRPRFCGGSHSREDESCGSTEEVQPGVA